MNLSNISIQIDEDVKKDAEVIFAKLGLTLSAATNVFYRQVILTQSIPFPLTIVEAGSKLQARKEFGETISAIQEQSVINGTSEITLEEINGIISECRQEANITK